MEEGQRRIRLSMRIRLASPADLSFIGPGFSSAGFRLDFFGVVMPVVPGIRANRYSTLFSVSSEV